MSDEDLGAKLKAAAEKMVGGKALTSKYGLDCFALVDKLLRTLGAATAADGDVPVTATADYDWGDVPAGTKGLMTQPDGSISALPAFVDPHVLFYRKDLYAQKGSTRPPGSTASSPAGSRTPMPPSGASCSSTWAGPS
jgi:hypothetical protein